MAVYRVPLTTWANTTVDVETDSTDADEIARMAEESARMPEESAHVSLCHQCANHLDVGDEWNAVKTDGDPSGHITKVRD